MERDPQAQFEHEPLRIVRAIVIELDERFLEAQTPEFGRNMYRNASMKTEVIEGVTTSLCHTHNDDGSITAAFGFAWYGDSRVLTADFVIERAITETCSQLKESISDQPTIKNVQLKSVWLDVPVAYVPFEEDVTKRAQEFMQKLSAFVSANPDDFK